MADKVTRVDGIDIIWRSKPARYDTRHLVFVFSGFGASSEFTYDFANAMDSASPEVIWIKDDFGGHASYYSSAAKPDRVANAIDKFISECLADRELTPNECTFLGASKGGSAALAHAAIYGYPNVISATPQLLRGSYLKKHWPENYHHLFPQEDSERLEAFDAEILDALKRTDPDKNVYLITSHADEQFGDQIAPYVSILRRIKNFNIVYADSDLVYQHNIVTSYATPVIMSLVNLLGAGLAPRLGGEAMKVRALTAPPQPTADPIVDLRQARFSEHRFFPQGVAALRGIACQSYGDIHLKLLLEENRSRIEMLLAKDNRPNLTRELFDGSLVRYDKAWFCSFRHAGLDLSNLPEGRYRVGIEIVAKGVRRESPLRAEVPFVSQSFAAGRGYRIEAHREGASLVIERDT